MLPDSFRWHLEDELEVAGIRTIDEHFGRLRKGERGRRLDGSHFFFFSYNNNGHYGHLMTEAVSRLWGWWPAKAEDPSLRILCRLHPTRDDTAAERLETFLLPALGISPEDIVWVDGPVEVESLVGCTPMWHNAPPLYFHPAMLEVWDRLRTGVMREDAHPGPSRLFITRRVGGRPCSNLGGRGALRRPWLHGRESRAAQCARAAALFAGARVVAGFGGSGMLNLAYAQAVETVIVLNQWAYRARNEHLFATAQPCTVSGAGRTPTIPRVASPTPPTRGRGPSTPPATDLPSEPSSPAWSTDRSARPHNDADPPEGFSF